MLLLGATQCAGRLGVSVESIQLVTSDIDRFWVAYPAAMRDTARAGQIFQEQYFAQASPGLREYFHRKYQGNAQQFARRITSRPGFYAYVKANTLAAAGQKPQILAALRRLQVLYPAVRYDPVYLLVGGFAGSTAQEPGLLIGVDQKACGPGVDESELTLVQRNRCASATELPGLIVHELIHNNQQPQDGTLLSAAIREGMADFVAELVTGSLGSNARLHRYGNAHEQELWTAFARDMGGANTKNWLANPAQETVEKPCDLGYYVGYKICQAYYTQAADGNRALAELLQTKDFPALLQRSGYAARWRR
jgi:hypothetical protein